MLPFIIEAGGGFRNGYHLAGIHQFDLLRFFVENHAVRSLGFQNLKFTQIEFFTDSLSIRTCGNGVYYFARVITNDAV